ncbi:PIG-L deacetylase family protein [Cohnella faecalis]|uniref:PIG-L family deacetylase n=1 Tax=Cohnella faecalis TaxID=2315694 RepID=A0A398CMC5_9BACL|nr:PIG-L family deacetylase [Cohnella faecalis]RIE03400.1 PIG-L family deacetylase [Cohnella faecalis]
MNQLGKTAFIYAHPDDESFLSACMIRRLADQEQAPVLLLATRGDAGGKNGFASQLTREQLGELREREMEAAARVLGLTAVSHLGIPDGRLDEADETEVASRIAEFANLHGARTLVTFPPDGGNGHRDHVAISRFTTAAVVSGRCETVRELYYVMSAGLAEQGIAPDMTIDAKPMWEMKARALWAHESQRLAIERYFGQGAAFSESRRYETFVVGWTAEGGLRL